MPIVRPLVRNNLEQIDPNYPLYYDMVEGSLVVGCKTKDCPVDVEISIEAFCGKQVMEPRTQSVTYSFEATPGCTAVTVTINGTQLGVLLPVSLNGSFSA